MCGILGGTKIRWSYERALREISHRGPDSQRIEHVKNLTLGFARLSIIDLREEAMQPMFSEDGRYIIVFNGEIYDYKKIRNELKENGYRFRTESDTEVLLYSFIEWKEKVIDHLDGIFAFAIFDTMTERLYLFRDRCGVKPLYYYDNGKDFAFSSELKGIKTLCEDENFMIDNTALYDYHTYLYIPDPKTMYKNVYKLPPAHYLVYNVREHKVVKVDKYWRVRLNTKEGCRISDRYLDQKAEELRYHLHQAVKRQIIADVPVGAFLSGGVDSSIITSVAHKYKKDITAYTIGFEDKRYDESIYAKKMAEVIDVKYESAILNRKEFDHIYRLFPKWFDEPYGDTSAYPTYCVSRLARKNAVVVLTGDGGDELFGGYQRCIYARDVIEKKKISNRRLSELYLNYKEFFTWTGINLDTICEEDIVLLASTYQYLKKRNRKKLREKYQIPKDYDDYWNYRRYYHRELPVLTRMRYLDFMTYLNGDILTKVDRTSMSVSLEARVPFLDREVIDFAFSLTQEECNPSGRLKGLLKYAFQSEIPQKMLERRKQGFSIPFSFIRKGDCPQEYMIEKLWNL